MRDVLEESNSETRCCERWFGQLIVSEKNYGLVQVEILGRESLRDDSRVHIPLCDRSRGIKTFEPPSDEIEYMYRQCFTSEQN